MASLELSLGRPTQDSIPEWVFTNYDISHSFVSAFIVIAMVWRVNKTFSFSMLDWPFYICLDFPFHSKEFFPTKLFWPLFDFSFDGIPWDRPEVWSQTWLVSLCYLSGGISKRNNSRLRHIKIRE